MRYYRPTWAEVNLGKIAHNFREIKKLLAPKIKVMVCVKADAYGHGLIPVAKKVISCGADYLGVASVDEGIALRENHIRIPVLILGMILSRDIVPLFKYNLTPTVCNKELALAINSLGRSVGRKINVHIKVDTGMGRLGILQKEALNFIKKVRRLRFINIEGIFTHFPLADSDARFTLRQIDMFKQLVERLKRAGICIPLVHAANSMGVIGFKRSHFNMVRPGLAIYGLYPKAGLKIRLKPVLSLKTKVIFVKNVPRGYGISYGHDYITKKPTRIITLPIGYGDGYPRNLSNRAPVLVHARRFTISGRICMDQIMVDVGRNRVEVGDEVVLIGSQGENKITAEELAGLAQTIPYEIVCGLGSRIPRIYLDK
jgi:alanine racemase